MKEIILRLMNDIFTLTQPVNPLSLKKIFDTYTLMQEPTSADIEAQHQILLQLQLLTNEYSNLSDELESHNLNQERLIKLSDTNMQTQRSRDALDEKLTTAQKQLSTDYSNIEIARNSFLQSQNPLHTPVSFPIPHEMRHPFISDLDVELDSLIKVNEISHAKSQLSWLKTKFAALHDELIMSGWVQSTDTSLPKLNTITLLIQEKILTLAQILEEGSSLQNKFARLLSVTELQSKKDEVKQSIQQLDKELVHVENDISKSTLSQDIQCQITKDFENSTDIPELLASYQSRQSSAWSYLDPSAWMSWLNSDQEYNEKQNVHAQSFIFLQLLNQKREFIAQKKSVLNEQKQLDSIVLENHDAPIDQGLIRLIADTIQLFKSIPSEINPSSLPENSPAIDYYLTLLISLSAANNSLDRYKDILDKLNELDSLALSIEVLRSKFSLNIENDDELPTLLEAEKNEGTLLTKELLEIAQTLLKMCKSYLINSHQLTVLSEELDSSILDQELLTADIESKKARLLPQEQIDSIKSHLIALAQNITDQISELKSHPVPQLQDEEATPFTTMSADESLEESSEAISEMSDSSEQLSSSSSSDEDSDWSRETQIDSNSVASSYQSTEVDTSESSDEDSESTTLLISDSSEVIRSSTPIVTAVGVYDSPSSEEDSDEYQSVECEILSVGNSPSPTRPPVPDASSKDPKTNEEVTTFSTDAPVQKVGMFPDLSDEDDEHFNSNFSDNSPTPERVSESRLAARKSLLLSTLDNIDKWHHENLTLLEKHPEDIQNWYHALHQSIKELSFDESQCHKASQLLRDILFELQNKEDLSVIRAYIRLCPEPKLSVKQLLNLKPALLITDMSYNETNELMDCPLELRPHYAHYFKLRAQYPVEAELFLQAVRTVHLIKLYMNIPGRKITQDHIPSLAADPRYEPLKRHRGFLKVWEFLEDLCRLIFAKITGQPEYEYTNRPCRFFKTKSAQLIEEADLMVCNIFPASTHSP